VLKCQQSSGQNGGWLFRLALRFWAGEFFYRFLLKAEEEIDLTIRL